MKIRKEKEEDQKMILGFFLNIFSCCIIGGKDGKKGETRKTP